jgi:hypothetical protein
MLLPREAEKREIRGGDKGRDWTHRVTPCIFGISFGSRMAYETPLKVVPTSNARTRERLFPLYGFRVSVVMVIRGDGRRV